MDETTLIIIAAVIVVLVAAGLLLMRRRQTQQLQSKFGSEYDRTLKQTGARSKAEAELQQRAKRVEKLSIRPLDPAQRRNFTRSWDHVQTEFVNNAAAAVGSADTLLQEVLSARAYPVDNFDQAAADISVDHPSVVENYRTAHEIALRHGRGDADTEDLRKAMLHYRKLFDELVTDGDSPKDVSKPGRTKNDAGKRARL